VGLGVAIVPGIAVERELATGQLRELPMDSPAMEFGFCLAWRRGEEPTPPVRMLLELLRTDAVAGGVAPGAGQMIAATVAE
jgi:DNA-binding transcriptional LysR family regulator